MSDPDFRGEQPEHSPSALTTANILTPKASAIAAFAFAVFSMLGQGSWSTALTALFWGTNYDVGSVDTVMVVWGIGCLLMAALAVVLARRALGGPDVTWDGHLARAAVIVAAVGGVLAVLEIVGGLIHGA